MAKLEEGDSFGELALLYSKPRMATIKCIERSHFVVLTKDDYNGAIAEIERRKTNEKINFIKMLPVFAKLSRTQLTRYTYNLKDVQIIKDSFLYKEGDLADKVFIIREGEFQILKRVKIKK